MQSYIITPTRCTAWLARDLRTGGWHAFAKGQRKLWQRTRSAGVAMDPPIRGMGTPAALSLSISFFVHPSPAGPLAFDRSWRGEHLRIELTEQKSCISRYGPVADSCDCLSISTASFESVFQWKDSITVHGRPPESSTAPQLNYCALT